MEERWEVICLGVRRTDSRVPDGKGEKERERKS